MTSEANPVSVNNNDVRLPRKTWEFYNGDERFLIQYEPDGTTRAFRKVKNAYRCLRCRSFKKNLSARIVSLNPIAIEFPDSTDHSCQTYDEKEERKYFRSLSSRKTNRCDSQKRSTITQFLEVSIEDCIHKFLLCSQLLDLCICMNVDMIRNFRIYRNTIILGNKAYLR